MAEIFLGRNYQNIKLETTNVIGGIRITDNRNKLTHMVARTDRYNGHTFTDIHGFSNEIKSLFDNGEIKTIKEISVY